MLISLVVPCFNEEDILSDTYANLIELSKTLHGQNLGIDQIEILFVDDGSSDDTWEQICNFSSSNLISIRGLKLARNYGHQFALLAGLENSTGDAVISIDADLQDDITVIPDMVERFILEGDQIVLGVRTNRSSDSYPKRVSAELFYKILHLLGDKTIPNHADFRLMSRKAIRYLAEFRDNNLYLRGIIPLIGLKTSTIGYSRLPRLAGSSKYTFRKMISLGWNGISSTSLWPLRAVSAIGFLALFVTTIIGIWAIFIAIEGLSIPGWASTVALISFLGGTQLLGLGILGEYVGKVLIETRDRPKYLIDTQI